VAGEGVLAFRGRRDAVGAGPGGLAQVRAADRVQGPRGCATPIPGTP